MCSSGGRGLRRGDARVSCRVRPVRRRANFRGIRLQPILQTDQGIEKRCLRYEDAFVSFGDGIPGAAVDFGNLDETTRAWRPFNMAKVADELGGVTVTFNRPRRDKLSRRLTDGAELMEWAAYRKSGFFLELAKRRGEWLFIIGILAFGNGPRAEVFLR